MRQHGRSFVLFRPDTERTSRPRLECRRFDRRYHQASCGKSSRFLLAQTRAQQSFSTAGSGSVIAGSACGGPLGPEAAFGGPLGPAAEGGGPLGPATVARTSSSAVLLGSVNALTPSPCRWAPRNANAETEEEQSEDTSPNLIGPHASINFHLS